MCSNLRSVRTGIKVFAIPTLKDLNVKFGVASGKSISIDGKRFFRYLLYSDEEPLKSSQFADGIYRYQEPVVERIDGIIIDLKEKSISFKDDGEILQYYSQEELHEVTKRILEEYWPKLDNPDVANSRSY